MLNFYLSLLDNEQEKQTFAAVYHKYKREALYAAYNVTRNQDMAEDALHNALMDIIEKHREYLELPEKQLRSKLMNIVRFKACDLMRREQLSRRVYVDDLDAAKPEDRMELSAAVASMEGYERLRACVKRLNYIHRITFELWYDEQKSYTEIAKVLEIEPENVRNRISRARGMVRAMLAKEGYGLES